MAIDHGEKRIGLAIKPAGQMMALPLGIIDAELPGNALQKIRGILSERKVDLVVVGLPVHADESQAKNVKRFTRKLRQGISGIRWRFTDETLTSESARESEREIEGKFGRPIDDRAAALILESFLQSPR